MLHKTESFPLQDGCEAFLCCSKTHLDLPETSEQHTNVSFPSQGNLCVIVQKMDVKNLIKYVSKGEDHVDSIRAHFFLLKKMEA